MENIFDFGAFILHIANIGIIVLSIAALVLIIVTCTKVIRYLNKKEKGDRQQ